MLLFFCLSFLYYLKLLFTKQNLIGSCAHKLSNHQQQQQLICNLRYIRPSSLSEEEKEENSQQKHVLEHQSLLLAAFQPTQVLDWIPAHT